MKMWATSGVSAGVSAFPRAARGLHETASTSQVCVCSLNAAREASRGGARRAASSHEISGGRFANANRRDGSRGWSLPRGGALVTRAASGDERERGPRSVPPGVARRQTRAASRRQRAIPEPAKLARIADASPSASPNDLRDVLDKNASEAYLGNIVDAPSGSSTKNANVAAFVSDADVCEKTVSRPVGTSSTAQAMANSVNILLGVGLLSVPYALKQGGWCGLGVLFLLGCVTNYTGKALIRVQARGSLLDSETNKRRPLTCYEDIGEAAFGETGRAFITFVLYTELVGTCALFFILEGDHLSSLFDGKQYLTHSSQWWQCASATVMIPTLWLTDLSALSYVGALGALASVSLVGVVAFQLASVEGFPLESYPPGFESTALLHLTTLPVSFGLLAFVFAGHAVFPAIYQSMAKPEEYEPMLDRTYAIVGLTCAVIGAAGYAMYGDAVKDEVTLNLPAASMASTAALALITVNPLSKFALTMDPVARGLESALGVRTNDDVSDDVGGDEKNPTRALLKARVLRTGLGLGALLAAAKVPFFAVVMSLIGSFLTLTVSVIFPAACHLKVFEDELTDSEIVVDWAIMFVGGFCVVAGSASAVADLLAK